MAAEFGYECRLAQAMVCWARLAVAAVGLFTAVCCGEAVHCSEAGLVSGCSAVQLLAAVSGCSGQLWCTVVWQFGNNDSAAVSKRQ